MDFFQWLYDIPGNVQGVVVAEDEQTARKKIFDYINHKFGRCDINLIYLDWRDPADDGICMITEM